MDDEVFFLGRKGASLEVWPQVVDPTKPATLATPLKAGISGHVTPAALAVVEHVPHQLLVFFRRPQTLPQLIVTHAVVLVILPGTSCRRGFRLPHTRLSEFERERERGLT